MTGLKLVGVLDTSPTNRSPDHKGLDLDRWVWNRKCRAWQKPIHIVTPSQWLADCVRESALMQNWPVSVVPNSLNVELFQPWPKVMARKVLGLPQDKTLVLFGADQGGKDPRKGWDLLQSALTKVAQQLPSVVGVVFGQSEPKDSSSLRFTSPLDWIFK